MMMKRACTALALLSILMLSPQATRAQGLDGGYGPWSGVSPGAFPDQTGTCPCAAQAFYPQQGMSQKLQSAPPTHLAGNSFGGGSQLNSASALGSLSDSVALSGYKRGRKKRATSLASKSATPKDAGAGSAATASTRKTTPQRSKGRSRSGAPVQPSIDEKRSHHSDTE